MLRLAFLVLAGINAPLVGDELAYQQIAVNVAAGRGFVQTNNPFFPGQVFLAWQAPLYPLTLGAIYFPLGPQPIFGRLFGVLIGVATVYLTFDLARRIVPGTFPTQGQDLSPSRVNRHRERIAWVAALIAAVYPGLLTAAHLLLSETLFTFLLVLAFDLIAAAVQPDNPFASIVPNSDSSHSPRHLKNPTQAATTMPDPPMRASVNGGRRGMVLIFAAGAAWGAATITRGIGLYFALPVVLWLGTSWPQIATAGKSALAQKEGRLPGTFNPGRALVFAVALALVVMPWTIRNLNVFHEVVLLETKGGVNFWLGNSPYTPSDFIRNVWKTGVRDPMLAALPDAELDKDHAAYALGEAYILREPMTFLERMPLKFADFWGFERNLVDAAEATRAGKAGGWNSPAKIVADLVSDAAYVILVLLAVIGLIFAGNDRWKLLIGAFLAYFVLVHMVVFGDGRFHLPLIPFLALYAAWTIVNGRRPLSSFNSRSLAAVVAGLVFAIVWGREILAAWGELRGGL